MSAACLGCAVQPHHPPCLQLPRETSQPPRLSDAASAADEGSKLKLPRFLNLLMIYPLLLPLLLRPQAAGGCAVAVMMQWPANVCPLPTQRTQQTLGGSSGVEMSLTQTTTTLTTTNFGLP
eukprot:m.102752 g.102752  ORF g.102752 m.102752 type:complete len:121 (-) comp15700_c0_seq3:284-646(-)